MSQTKERAQWGRQIEFIFTLIGYAVGLGNVWRFPYLCFRNGGGAFLIPYVICLICLGIPIFGLEISFGQFGGKGPISIWDNANPIFKGIGFAGVLISIIISIYYDIIIAWSLYYLFASMTDKLPWEDCNDCACQLYNTNSSDTINATLNNSSLLNCTGFDGSPRSPSEIYYRDVVLSESGELGNWGILKWDLSLCNLLSWIIVFIVLSKGIKSLGKVVYVTAIFPYILLTILLIRGSLLDGALEGIKFYLTPDLSRLTDASVWGDAAVQIFFSLSACQGGLMAMASYNKFNNNVLRDAIMIPIINCLTSFYAGFVVFSVLGYMAHERGLPVANVTQGGAGLAFIVYPEALSKMPLSPVWAILFFLMLCMLGFSSQFSTAEAAMTGIIDEFPRYLSSSKRVVIFRACVCAAGFLLGLPMLTQGGSYLLDLIDGYILGFPTLFMGLLETIAICWVYGYKKFSKDIEAMVGRKPFAYFILTWVGITPILLMGVIGFKAYQYVPLTHKGDPQWAESLGWMIALAPITLIALWFVYYTWANGLLQATPEWFARRQLGDPNYSPKQEIPPDYDNIEINDKNLNGVNKEHIVSNVNYAYTPEDEEMTKF